MLQYAPLEIPAEAFGTLYRSAQASACHALVKASGELHRLVSQSEPMTPQERVNFGLHITKGYRSCTFHIDVLLEQESIATHRIVGTIISESQEILRVSNELVRKALQAMTAEERYVIAICVTSGARDAMLGQENFDTEDEELIERLDQLFFHVREQIEKIDI